MKKCLNCGKEVVNKFCGTRCQNEYRGKLNVLKYDLEPKKCGYCGKFIPYVSKDNKYCGSSCSAKSTNGNRNRTDKIPDDVLKREFNNTKSISELLGNIGFSRTNKIKKRIENRLVSLGLVFEKFKHPNCVGDKTKTELFNERKNWQSARSTIRKHACVVYNNIHFGLKCNICGYDKHVEIAHIKSVSEFSGDTKINDINNLISLCPNHHWEFDNGVLDIK